MADYCIARMKPYIDPRTEQPITGEDLQFVVKNRHVNAIFVCFFTGALDYLEFTRTLFC